MAAPNLYVDINQMGCPEIWYMHSWLSEDKSPDFLLSMATRRPNMSLSHPDAFKHARCFFILFLYFSTFMELVLCYTMFSFLLLSLSFSLFHSAHLNKIDYCAPRDWFFCRFLPVKIEIFLSTVTKCHQECNLDLLYIKSLRHLVLGFWLSWFS